MSVIAPQPELLAPAAAQGRRASGSVDAVAQQLQALVGSMDSMFARVSAMQRRASAQYFGGADKSSSDWDLELDEHELAKCSLAPVKHQIAAKIVTEMMAATPEVLRKSKALHSINSPSVRSPEPDSTRDFSATELKYLHDQTTSQRSSDTAQPTMQQTATIQQSAKKEQQTPTQHREQPSATEWVVEAVAEPVHLSDIVTSHKTVVQHSQHTVAQTSAAAQQPTAQTSQPESAQQQQQPMSKFVVEAFAEPTSIHQLPASTKLAKAYPLKAASSGDFSHQLHHHQTFRPQPLEHSQSVYQLHHSPTTADKSIQNSADRDQTVIVSISETAVTCTSPKAKTVRAASTAKTGLKSVFKRTVSFPSQAVRGNNDLIVDENFIISALEDAEQLASEHPLHNKGKKNSITKKVLRFFGQKLTRKSSKSSETSVRKSHTVHPGSLDATQRTISDETYTTVESYTTVPEEEEEEEEREGKVENIQAVQSPHCLKRADTAPTPATAVEEEVAVVPVQSVEEAPIVPAFTSADFDPLVDLATGSFGKATLCRYKKTGAPCVLKAVLKGDVLRRNQQRQLLWEKWSMATLSMSDCPFVVRIYGAFLEPRVANFVLEYVAGGELFSYMREKRRLCESQAKFYAAQVLLALEHMQKEHSIVYRDLKPENLLINYDGYIKMVDFGFAKQLKRTDRTYTQCGTTDYLAPEIILSKGHGYEVDMWSFGVLLFEMLCGDVPFKGENPYALYSNIIHGTFTMPEFLSPAAKSIILGLLTVDRTCRLGCSKYGISELRLHPFFQDVDFPAIRKKRHLAPYLPQVMHPFDMQNFRDTATALPQQQPEDPAELPPKYYQMCAIIDQREFPDFDCWLSEPTI